MAATPRKAVIHKAIMDTISTIETELQLCHRVFKERPLESNANFPSKPFPHAWKLEPFVEHRVRPDQNTYEYIDGSFRPNTQKVLQLLGSEELYSTPLAAIRELLQNSFDAVRERMRWS